MVNLNFQQSENNIQIFLPVHQNDASAEEDKSYGAQKCQRQVIWKPGWLATMTQGHIGPRRAIFIQGQVAVIAVIHHRVGEITLKTF